MITVKPGDRVLAGEPIASIFAQDAAGIERGFEALRSAIRSSARSYREAAPLISHRVTRAGVEELARESEQR